MYFKNFLWLFINPLLTNEYTPINIEINKTFNLNIPNYKKKF
jgi:hypothetical protein